MARGIVVLITVTEVGDITVDVRGPVKGKEGLVEILKQAQTLAEQSGQGIPIRLHKGHNVHDDTKKT